MPIDKLVLILVCVIAAAAATLWIGAIVLAAFQIPLAGIALIPALLVGYVLWRVLAERLGNDEEDHYDGIEH